MPTPVMRRLAMRLVAACVALALGGAARAQDAAAVPEADRDAIRSVIEQQLQAFRGDDAAGAFAAASPEIQAMFGDPAHFLAMVRQGYPPVYRPRSHAFGVLDTEDGRIVQRVELVGPDGQPALALYFMEQETDGTWRIDGCVLTQSDSVGA